jgi:hypothetical protein
LRQVSSLLPSDIQNPPCSCANGEYFIEEAANKRTHQASQNEANSVVR